MDFDWNDAIELDPFPDVDQIEMMLTYVPELEWLDLDEAWLLARERDWDAAITLEESVIYG